MVRILLTPQRLDTESNRLIQAAADMNCINSEIARIVSSLDWQVRSRGNVERLIERAASDGKTLATEVERLGQYLRIASQTFQEADANAKTRLEETTCMMPINAGAIWGVAAAGAVIPRLITGWDPINGTRLDWIKKIIGNGHNYIITDPVRVPIFAKKIIGNGDRYITDPVTVPIFDKRLVDPIEQPVIERTTILITDPYWSKRVVKLPATNIDSFNDVSTDYSPDQSNKGLNYNVKGYQCSDYVKKYFANTYKVDSQGKTVTGVIINNLLPNKFQDENGIVHNGIPHFTYTVDGHPVSGDMISTTTPQPGDVVSVGDGEHWAIVKEVDGKNVIVIEQNYMYKDDKGQIVAPVNRRVEISGNKFYKIP